MPTSVRPPWIGLVLCVALVAAALAVPPMFGWEVWARAPRSLAAGELPPLHGYWEPKLLGAGTLPALVIAVLGWRYAVDVAERLSWQRLLLVSYVVGLAWLLALAFVDGTSGISRVLGDDYEYLRSARAVTDVHQLLTTYVDRIPYSAPDNWPTHPAGHPPGALLFFVGLVKVGLGGDLAAGLVVTVIAATTALAVLVTLRALGAEVMARRAAPFLVLTPAAVFMAVSADAVFAAVAAWGLACLALGATSPARGRSVAWSTLAGLLLGYGVLMSYGLPLVGLIAVAVLVLARSWLPLPVAAATALVVVLALAAGGFSWWEAYPVLNDRYWDGIAADRPASYWLWGNLAALVVCAGPLLGAGLAQVVALRRKADRVVLLLVSAAAAAIVVADLSRMSKAEVERIWLPFVPWLLLSAALLPERWRRTGVLVQVVSALLVQQLLYTSW
ncbi:MULTISPECIES: hypothetical protein [unclassified Nocardioides]|uniref:hypothetical protein n=1 Tax=unclassified Nocardioides TaxID=2615069 RepID=UPI0009F08F9F|nr:MULTISPECIES: hypothetical protein [unclassified Nocardioides]GAW49371.1 Putative membrane protein [Nocardioides sp. PD653-B2]GAW55115.1 putative membrane protein [Nocardioides sp. PD653]